MKAKTMLGILHEMNVCKGKHFAESAKKQGYYFEVLEGEIRPNSMYFRTFHANEMSYHTPDAVIRIGGGDKQYLYRIE